MSPVYLPHSANATTTQVLARPYIEASLLNLRHAPASPQHRVDRLPRLVHGADGNVGAELLPLRCGWRAIDENERAFAAVSGRSVVVVVRVYGGRPRKIPDDGEYSDRSLDYRTGKRHIAVRRVWCWCHGPRHV